MTHILTHDQFQLFQQAISAKTAAKTLTSADIVLYNIIRDKPAHRGFTPITNSNKMQSLGWTDGWTAFNNVALVQLKSQLKYSAQYLESFGLSDITQSTKDLIVLKAVQFHG